MPATPVDHQPSKQASPVVLAVCGIVLAAAGFLRVQQAVESRKPVEAEAVLRGRTFRIEVADTIDKREKGLGGRDSLPADQGMFFPFPAAQYWVFWMKGMRFPIDIIWIQDGKVVDIDADVPAPKGLPLETYSPTAPADAVLELNAGIAADIGLEKGDELTFR